MTDSQNSALSGPGLAVVGGVADGTVLELSLAAREYRLGSTPNCELQVDLSNVDALHARVTIDGTRLLLSDAGSATGTYVNGEKTGPLHELQDGDRISLGPPGSKGSARLLVHLPEGSFTSRFAPQPPRSSGAFSQTEEPDDASGLAPFSSARQQGQEPWSLMPPNEAEGGLELSSSGDSVFPRVTPQTGEAIPSMSASSATGGLELSGSGDSFFPTLPPLSTPRLPDVAGGLELSAAGDPTPFGDLPAEGGLFSGRSSSEISVRSDPSGLVLGGPEDSNGLVPPTGSEAPEASPHQPFLTLPSLSEPAAELQPARRIVPPAPSLPETVPPPLSALRPEVIPPPPPVVPPRAPIHRPEYTTDLPSIDVEGSRSSAEAPADRSSETRPAAPAASPRRTGRRRSRGFSFSPSPQLLMALGAIVGIGALTGAFFLLRPMFRRPPTAETANPGRVQPGQTLMVTGTGFDTNPSGNTVKIGSLVGNITSATSTQLAVTVPTNAAPAGPVDLTVVVTTSSGSSQPLKVQVYRAPRITSVDPDVVMAGQEVMIRGENLDGKPLVLSFAGVPAEVREASTTVLKAVVPAIPVRSGGTVMVAVAIGPDAAQPMDALVGRLPLVLGLEPQRGVAGDRIQIKGRGFATDDVGNQVLIGTQRALILSSSPNMLTVVAPGSSSGFSEENVTVQVTSKGVPSSNPASFSIIRSSGGSYVPRFFAAPALDSAGPGAAFVACELGPIFALGAKGDDASTAERAVRVSGELNAIVEQALVRRLTVELVEKPTAAVSIAGNPKPILTALAEDAAVYPRLLEGANQRAKAPTTRALASLWTALLRDTLALFAYRERPLHMLEQSSKARVFSDLYAEALRASGPSSGVSVRLVLPTSPALSRSFRETALSLTPETGKGAGAAVEGKWDGRMEADGSRPFQLRLRLEGARLVGSVTAQAGQLSMNTPIRDAVYEKGQLRFVVDLYGSPRLLTGTVAADTITGTIERAGGDKAQLGTFTLRFVE